MKNQTYHFEIPIKILNPKDTFVVGEKVILTILYDSKLVYDFVSRQSYDWSDFKFRPKFHCNDLLFAAPDFFNGFSKCLFSYDFPIQCEKFSAGSISYRQYAHNYINSYVQDTFVLTLNNPGVYAYFCDTKPSAYKYDGQTFPGQCPKSSYVIEWKNESAWNLEQLAKYANMAKDKEDLEFFNNTNPEYFSFTFVVVP